MRHGWWEFRRGWFIFMRMYLPPRYVAYELLKWEERHPEPKR